MAHIRRAVYLKPPNGSRWCHGCNEVQPTKTFDKPWDQSCNKWPKLRRGRPKTAKPAAPPLMEPALRRWICSKVIENEIGAS